MHKKKSYDRHSLKRPSENVVKFEYSEMTVINQNNVYKQVRNTPKLGNVSYHFHPVVSYLKSTDEPFDTRIKSSRATLPAGIFSWGF